MSALLEQEAMGGISSDGRATALQAVGRRFNPDILHTTESH